MSVASVSQDLYGFALELRRLADTMPGGREDPRHCRVEMAFADDASSGSPRQAASGS